MKLTISKECALQYLLALTELKAIASTTSGDYNNDVVEELENDLHSVVDTLEDPENDEPKSYAKIVEEYNDNEDENTFRYDADVYADELSETVINAKIISSAAGDPDDHVSISFFSLLDVGDLSAEVTNLSDESETQTTIGVVYIKRGAKQLSLGEVSDESDDEVTWHHFSVSKFNPDFVHLLSVNKVYRVML